MYRPARASTHANDTNWLRRAEILGALPDNILSHLVSHSRTISLRKGSTIFLPGDAAALYVVTRGRVAIVSQPTPEVEVEISARRPYELFGEASPFSGTQLEQARALETVETTRIEATAVRAALEEDPHAASAFTALLARRLSAANERVSELGVHAVTERLFLLLTHLARDCGISDSRGALIPYRLTHDELGRLAGASRVAISHAMRRLRDQGRIATSGRHIIVPGN